MSTQAAQIRDAIYDLLMPLPGFVKVRKVVQRQLQPEETPCITVLRGDENLAADEDATAGPPHFVHDATFHVSIIRGFDDPVVLDGRSDDDMDLVQETLLRNPDLIGMFEGIVAIRRSHAWPQVGDAYYVELRLELTVQYRSEWEPIIPDDFQTAEITIVPFGDVEASQITTIIDLPQS